MHFALLSCPSPGLAKSADKRILGAGRVVLFGGV
jgi:hypothetical protein